MVLEYPSRFGAACLPFITLDVPVLPIKVRDLLARQRSVDLTGSRR